MPQEQPALQPQADMLTRKLLRKAGVGGNHSLYALLELLCTDSIYTFKDEFDFGLDERVWATYRRPEPDPEEDYSLTGRDFGLIDGEPNSSLVGDPGLGEGDNIRLVGRTRRWLPNRRPVIMTRLRLESVSGVKLEFGFADVDVELIRDTHAAGVVNSASTPTARAGHADFAVACLDTDSDEGFHAIVHSRPQTSSTAQTGAPDPLAATEFSLMVATNEMNECRVWVDGALAATVRNTVQTGRYVTAPLALWLYMENRAIATIPNRLRVAYVQAWQERATLI